MDDIDEAEEIQKEIDPHQEPMEQDEGEHESKEFLPETGSQIFEKFTEKPLDEQFENKNREEVTDENEEEEGNGNVLPNVKEYQSKQDEATCLMPNDLSEKLEVNTKDTDIIKQRGEGKPDVVVALGENVVPSNILREEHLM